MQVQTRKSQQGFTIIELVVVILLLGILAATALPRFIDVTEQAHDAVFSGVGGSFVTGTALYRAEWVARGQPATNSEVASYGNLQVAPGFSLGSYTAENGTNPSNYAAQTAFSGRASGYPYGVGIAGVTPLTFAQFTPARCVEVFDNLLQIGAPVAIATTGQASTDFGTAVTADNADNLRTAVTTAQAASAGDFQVFVQNINVDTGFENNLANGNPTNTVSGQPLNHQQQAPACVFAYSAEAENHNRFVLYVPWNGRTDIFTSAEDLLDALTGFDGALVP